MSKIELLKVSSCTFRQVRDELEHLLDDDIDMAAMHLSEKLAYQAADSQSSRFAADNEPSEFDEERYIPKADR